MIIVVSPPVVDPEVPEVPGGTGSGSAAGRRRLQFTWTGTDGVEWDLANGPVTLARGASGFGIPKPTHRLQESPSLDGATWQGKRTGPREVFLPVHIKGGDADGQLDTEAAFFAGLDPDAEGILRVSTHRGTSREIRCRYDDGGDIEFEMDPVLIQYAPYPLKLIAADPYWSGAEVTTRIPYPTSVPSFYTGPPFRLAPSSILGSATVTNPGDQSAYPVWLIEGPFTSFAVGIGSSVVTMGLTKALGEWVRIDMDPTQLTMVDETGADQWDNVGDVAFAPIPAGTTTVTATITGASAGSAMTCTFTPRYRRAYS